MILRGSSSLLAECKKGYSRPVQDDHHRSIPVLAEVQGLIARLDHGKRHVAGRHRAHRGQHTLNHRRDGPVPVAFSRWRSQRHRCLYHFTVISNVQSSVFPALVHALFVRIKHRVLPSTEELTLTVLQYLRTMRIDGSLIKGRKKIGIRGLLPRAMHLQYLPLNNAACQQREQLVCPSIGLGPPAKR